MLFIPQSEQDIKDAISHGLYESSHLEAREYLPMSDLVIVRDIAAMALRGGVLLYGVGEATSTTQLKYFYPFHLTHHVESIAKIAQHKLHPPVNFNHLQRSITSK